MAHRIPLVPLPSAVVWLAVGIPAGPALHAADPPCHGLSPVSAVGCTGEQLIAALLAQPGITVHADGLTNPRHLRLGPDGALYVAEAGIGGDSPSTCPIDNMFSQPGPYGGGHTGRISRILDDGSVETVAEGLPSSHDGFGDALGPSDIAWIGSAMYVTIEGGGCSRGLAADPAGIVHVDADGGWDYVADVSAFIRANPVANEPLAGPQGDEEPDGVPHSLLPLGDELVVVETNHNSILRVDPRDGDVSRVYDLSVQDPAPIILARHGDELLLGSFDGLIQTFGENFGEVETLEDGYGPIVDLATVGDDVLILETFAVEAPWTPWTGRVVRRAPDGRRDVLIEGLNRPIGMAVGADGALYVSTESYGLGLVEGRGHVLRIDGRL